ncbi:MAG: hypothetical protein RLZZ362_2564 [Actinomycetota bacterium]|jgi:hypothetical protein
MSEDLLNEPAPPAAKSRPWSILAIPIVPLVLYALVAPDWYYLQNGLDPFFYTGYVQNFTEIFHAVGNDHYFISRWTVYLPQRALFMVFDDPKIAFLVFRWIGATVIVAAVYILGRGRWRRWDAVALAAIVLMTPMSIRALCTDYSDAIVYPAGAAMIVAVAVFPDRGRWVIAAGALAGCMIVANPFALTVVAAALPFWLGRLERKRWLPMLGLATAGAALVMLGGLLLFRWHYGIDNVYEPTLDFLRTRSGEQDPLKSPRLWWLGYRLWIYLPLLVIVVFHAMRRWFAFEFGAVETMIVRVCALQYAIQIWYQFARHGSTLEISYYWSYILPSFVLATCVVLGALGQRAGRWTLPAVAVGLAVLVRIVGDPTPEVFQSWIDAAVVVVVVVVALRRHPVLRPALMTSALATSILFVQFGSPRPEPSLDGELRVLSAYELAYDASGSPGIQSFETVSWFVEEMKAVPESVIRSSVFWYQGAVPARMAAMYGVQVSGLWLNPNWPDDDPAAPFPADAAIAVQQGYIPSVVVIGSAAAVDAVSSQLAEIEPAMTERLHLVAPGNIDVSVSVMSTVEE